MARRFTCSRPGNRCPLEATAADKFIIESAGIVIEFDAAKNQMIIKRGGGERFSRRQMIPRATIGSSLDDASPT